ncbi:capsid cement protein [Nesterenkonia sp. K-15-9-6]|uniref:capsid cement protein n=1 Tax=Nesterenkonia sp. K-15-9-6 TaxID=3093918 RepID=UPI00404426E6
MATNQRYGPRADHIALTATEAVSSGDPVVIGAVAGVAKIDAAAGDRVTVWTVGSYDLTVDGAASEGDVVFYDAGALNTSGAGVPFGVSLGEKPAGEDTLEVRPFGFVAPAPDAGGE